MTRRMEKKLNVLVVDIGGSHVKFVSTRHSKRVKFTSGSKLTPEHMVKQILKSTEGWRFDAVSIGYPGVIREARLCANRTISGRAGSALISRPRSAAPSS